MPVIRRHGPLEGVVTRASLCAAQAARLDRFGVRQAMARAAEDIAAGRIVASMAIDRQAAALRDAVVREICCGRREFEGTLGFAEREGGRG